jgi:hypothetical protein
VPLFESVSIPMVSVFIDEQKNFKANPKHEKSAAVRLKELKRWTNALVQLRK